MRYDPNSVEWLFRIFERLHHNYIHAEMNRRGLSRASHPSMLFALKQYQGHPASQKQLADSVGISAPTAAVSIDRMQKAGLLKRVTDKNDRRRNLITFTEKGLLMVEQCEQVFDETDQAIFEGFSAEEKEQLKSFYLRLISKLKELDAQNQTLTKKEQ